MKIDEVEVTSKYYKWYNPRQLSEPLRLETSLLKAPQHIQIINSEIFRVLKPGGMFINFYGDFGATVFSQVGHERYPKEIMEEANAIKSHLDISKHSRQERDLYLLDKVGFIDLKTDIEVHNKIYSKPEEEGR